MFGRNNGKSNFQYGYYQQNPYHAYVNNPYGYSHPPYQVTHHPQTFQPEYGHNEWQNNNAYYSNSYLPSYQPFTNTSVNSQSYVPRPQSQKDHQFLFQNPLQPKEDILHPYYQQQMPISPNVNQYPNANPYPKQTTATKKSGGVQSIMNSFKGQDGSVDLNKMMNTAGQMMNAVNQVSSLVKGIGGMFKI